MKKIFYILFLVLFSLQSILSLEENISYELNKNFNNFLYKEENVELVYFEGKQAFYELKRKKSVESKNIDLYLSFDKLKNFDDSGNYKVTYNQFHFTENRSIYKKGAYFTSKDDRLELVGTNSSFFQSGVNLGSFSISFWVYPATFSTNEIILKIGSQYYNRAEDNVEDESIVAKTESGKMVWEFNNIFKLGNKLKENLRLESFDKILPEKWTNINLTYDSYSGIIKLFVNGKQSATLCATEDRTIYSSVLNIRFHPTNRCIIKIAPNFFGAIDEFVITRDSKQSNFEKYEDGGGVIYSDVIELDKGGAYILKVTPDETNENNSNIVYYYRYADSPFYPDFEYSSEIKWNILGKEKLDSKKIRYIQWKILLLPGLNGEYSPKFRGIKLTLNRNIPPSKPIGLQVLAGDGKIKIKWIKNSEKDLKGYKIYYGTKSEYYFGKDAKEGDSPIIIGATDQFELTGLKNNLIYYIVISAFDDEMNNESDFSGEIQARPME
ncbi:MAG: hypothetical protein A2Z98_05055 [Spirochaetes bacterium GWB1_27_13]|nr:MAG: hypothetical protein A2Z98_05055 [Spirochaetes bacterium GWB1_27_13]